MTPHSLTDPKVALVDRHALEGLRTLGVPATTLRQGKRKDWRTLRLELDRFSAFGYGDATQRRFMHEPHPGLQMRTPVEMLTEQDGIARVRLALRETLSAHAD